MSKYKLIAFDVDDTLLNTEKAITPKTKEALLNAQKNGVKLCVATGRLPYGARKYAEELDILRRGGYYMSFNGGAIFNSDDRCISKNYLEKSLIEPVYNILRPTTATTVVHKDDKMYADRKVNPFTDRPTRANRLPLNLVDDIAEFVDWDLYKLVIVDEREKLINIQKEILARFGGELDAYFSAPWFLEVMPKGINKGKGIEAVCDDMGIGLGEVIAFGDNYNDIPMLKAAGVGVAMGNAEKEVKKYADLVTDSCDSDGIAKALGILL